MTTQARSLHDETFHAPSAVTVYRCITFDGAQCTVQGEKVAGVARNDALAGDDYAATVIGTAVVETGAAVAVGDGLICDTQGRAIPTSGQIAVRAGATAVTSTAANGTILQGGEMPEYVFADALQAAAGAGQFIEVLLRR